MAPDNLAFLDKLLQYQFTTFPDYVTSCSMWWKYVVMNPGQTRGLFTRVDLNTRVTSLQIVMKYRKDPDVISALFGTCVTEQEILNLLTFR